MNIGGLKKTFIKVYLDGEEHSAHTIFKESPLSIVRSDIQLDNSIVFLNGEAPIMDADDENEVILGEILTWDQQLHLKTLNKGGRFKSKPVPTPGPGPMVGNYMRYGSFERPSATLATSKLLPNVKLLHSDKNGLKIYKYPHKVPKKDPNYPDAEVLPASKLT